MLMKGKEKAAVLEISPIFIAPGSLVAYNP